MRANGCFPPSTAFRDSAQPDVDLGSNIGGVVLGGLSEYLSLVVGFNGLLLGVFHCQVRVDLGLVDALPKLVAGFRGRGLHRCFRLRGALHPRGGTEPVLRLNRRARQ